MRSALIAAGLVALAAGTAAAQTPFQELEQARREFRSNNFAVAIPLLKDLVYPEPRLARSDELLEVHLLLGTCEFEIGNRNDAHDEFVKALTIQPDYQLDSLLYSPGAVKVFDDTKAEVTARLKAEQAQRDAEAKLEATRVEIANLRFYDVRPLIVNFVPFGIGQYYNSEPSWKIATLALGEGVTFAASTGIWAYLVNEYGYNGRVPPASASNVQRLQQVEIGAGAVFFAAYALGVVDSLLHYNRRTLIQPGDLPPSLLPAPPPRKTSLRDRLHFGPLVLPSGLGVGLALED